MFLETFHFTTQTFVTLKKQEWHYFARFYRQSSCFDTTTAKATSWPSCNKCWHSAVQSVCKPCFLKHFILPPKHLSQHTQKTRFIHFCNLHVFTEHLTEVSLLGPADCLVSCNKCWQCKVYGKKYHPNICHKTVKQDWHNFACLVKSANRDIMTRD